MQVSISGLGLLPCDFAGAGPAVPDIFPESCYSALFQCEGFTLQLILICIQVEFYNPTPSGQPMNAFVIWLKGGQGVT